MTDLTTAVEAGARAYWESVRNPHSKTWEQRSPVEKYELKQLLLPVVTAVVEMVEASAKLPEGAFRLAIVGCARCHGDGHDDVLWTPLTHPVEANDVEFTHWAPCPANGQPILMRHIVGEHPPKAAV